MRYRWDGHEPDDTATRHPPPVDDTLRGRDAELDDLAELAEAERLVTVLGPGGTGKTRFAEGRAWPDGVIGPRSSRVGRSRSRGPST